MQAADEGDAAARLRAEGALVLEITLSGKEAKPRGKKKRYGGLSRLFIPRSQVERSFRQMASIMRADVSILKGLDTVAGQCSGRLSNGLLRVRERVRNGTAFSTALEEETAFAGRVALGLITVGENNGTLDQMLAYCAELMEKARKLRNEIIQAFSYPCFVMLVAIGIAWFMATRVIPTIIDFMEGQPGGQVPAVTQALLDVTAFFQAYGLYIMAAPVLLVVSLVVLRSWPSTGEIIDRNLLKIPLLGGAFRSHANAMWTRTLGALIGSGVDIIHALALVENTMGNIHYSAQFRSIRESVQAGHSLTRSVGETTLSKLSPNAYAMVEVGEQSGGIDEALAEVYDYNEDYLRRRVNLLSKLVEPAMYAIVGGMVGFIYFAFFMALISAQSGVM